MAYGSVKMCLQCATCGMVSTCLFRALRFLSYRDSRVQKEACQWPKGKNPAPGDPRGQGLHRHRHRARLSQTPPGHPRGM